MLKIKDNIKLEELEKYGFENNDFHCVYKDFEIKTLKYHHLFIDKNTKKITLATREVWEEDYNTTLEMLYSLIQTGLVEKVEG